MKEKLLSFFDGSTGGRLNLRVEDGDPTRFVIPPGIAHAFKNVGTTAGFILGHADRPLDHSDFERVDLL